MIQNKITDPNRGLRIVIIVLGLITMLAGIPVWIVPGLSAIECTVATVAMGLAGLVPITLGTLYFPYVILDHEGVTVRFFRKKTFPWNQILQAGRYHRDRRTPEAHRYALVLVLPGGSPKRAGNDRGFLGRNRLRTIVLPNNRDIRLLICARYGRLDFDDYDQLSESKKKAYRLDQT